MGLPARLRSSVKGVLVDGDVTTTRSGNAVRYDEAGRLVGMRFPAGGNLWRTNSYAPFGQQGNDGGMLTGIQVGTAFGNGSSLTVGYAYDSFGNVATLTDGGAWPFTYDGQNRVIGAFNRVYSYWPSGRFNQFEGVAYSYGTGAGGSPLHAVMSTGAGGDFDYNRNGSMTGRKANSSAAVQTLTWSGENRLASVSSTSGRVESYLYDEGGERIRTVAAQGGITTTTYYLFPHHELEVTGSTGTIRRSYFFAGQRIAQTVNGGTVTYLHTDQLGSTVLTTGAGGSQRYNAYGSTRSGTVPTKYQYTGQEADGGTGLIYMKARYYDPVIGQFISPDTIVPDPNNLYAYNRYMYAYGNPLKYSDPGGHCVFGLDTIVCVVIAAAAAGAGGSMVGNIGAQAVEQMDSQETWSQWWDTLDINWKEAGIAAGAGAIGGGAAPLVGPVGYIGINAVAGAGQKVATDVIVDKESFTTAVFDWNTVLAGGLASAGAVAGGLDFPRTLTFPVSEGDAILVETGKAAAALGGAEFAQHSNAWLFADQVRAVAGPRAWASGLISSLPLPEFIKSWFPWAPDKGPTPCTVDPNDGE